MKISRTSGRGFEVYDIGGNFGGRPPRAEAALNFRALAGQWLPTGSQEYARSKKWIRRGGFILNSLPWVPGAGQEQEYMQKRVAYIT